MGGSRLEVKKVVRSFQVGGKELVVLKGVDLVVKPGSLVMLKGRSGSGKTTLLNILGGLDLPTSGEVWFDDQPLHQLSDAERTRIRRKKMGFIFQAFALMPLLSAYENIELSMRMADVPRRQWKEQIEECLELVGLSKRKNHRPYELSGGEQQRVAIARAIAHKPSIILADEPTAELDSKRSIQMIETFKQLIDREGMTICMTTHDPAIMEVADEIYEMVDGQLQRI
jgi:putative ABC transport system ATP-binding protein